MKIAIIGAGLAGLGTAYFLLQSKQVKVSIFEAKRIGAGASGIASGLLHPYPGFSAHRSHFATAALLLAKQLISIAQAHTSQQVVLQEGIFRLAQNPKQKERLLEYSLNFKDLHYLNNDLFLIETGMTIDSNRYLEGLANTCREKGGTLYSEKIENLEQLKEFDQIIIAAGFGVKLFPECEKIPVEFLKGQLLCHVGSSPYEKSFISKGYLAHRGTEKSFEIGATYERHFSDEIPNLTAALDWMKQKHFFQVSEKKIQEVKAAVRVCPLQGYLPMIEKLGDKVYVFTGLGSRGLLYHALFGKRLAEAILFKNNILS